MNKWFIAGVISVPALVSGLLTFVNISYLEVSKPYVEPVDRTVSLIAVGDIMLSRGVAQKIKARGSTTYPFSEAAEYLRSGDIVFGNLESPIADGRVINSFEFEFRADPGAEDALGWAGFNILSLANNHTPNFGERGLLETFENLTKNDIAYVGAGRNAFEANEPRYVEKNGIKFAFLAYNSPTVVPTHYEAGEARAGTAFMRVEKMREAVHRAKLNARFVIVSIHAGEEYVFEPNKEQVDFARAAIDAGADLVLGHHSHVVQTLEKYKGKFIFYGLGNFIFDQMWSDATREGIVVKIVFDKDGVSLIEARPVLIEDYSRPRFISTQEGRHILGRLQYPFEITSDRVYISIDEDGCSEAC